MDEDFDLERFVELFDTAMTSNSPKIRKAFKKLMIVASLVDSENTDKVIGPMARLVKDFELLTQRVGALETSKHTYIPPPYTMTGSVNIPSNPPYYSTTYYKQKR